MVSEGGFWAFLEGIGWYNFPKSKSTHPHYIMATSNYY